MVITEVPVPQIGLPLASRRYTRFATAEAFPVATVRVIALRRFDWRASGTSAYGTSESAHSNLSVSDWERVLREVRLIEEIGAVMAPTPAASQDIRRARQQRFRLFSQEREFVKENWQQLNAKYASQYIAVLGASVLDSDIDFSSLASRVYRRFGYRRIFMPFVSTHKRVYRIPSPRVVR